MSGPSPQVLVSDAGGGYVGTTGGVNVGGGDAIALKLASYAGVKSWAVSSIGTDDLTSPPNMSTSGSGSSLLWLFTAVATPASYIFQSMVNGALDGNNVYQASYITTFAIYVLTGGGLRVIGMNESTQGSRAGWLAQMNTLIRQGGGIVGNNTTFGGLFTGTTQAIANAADLYQGYGTQTFALPVALQSGEFHTTQLVQPGGTMTVTIPSGWTGTSPGDGAVLSPTVPYVTSQVGAGIGWVANLAQKTWSPR